MVISVDPGLTGAAAVLDHNGLQAVFDLPTMPIPGVGPKAMVQRKLDGRALCTLLRKHCPASAPVASIVIEAVGTMGGQNNAIQTQGALLRTLGAIEAVAECLVMPISYANPQTWKRFYGLINHSNDTTISASARSTAAKRMAMETARSLYPACTEIARAKDHNRAEAILIGHWWLRKNA